MLDVGTKAPEFSLPDQDGVIRNLQDFRGQKVVLYFYSKDMTSGCSSQALAFAELYPQFREKGAVVLGVSKDTVETHKRFEQTRGLSFTLLSDPDMDVMRAYDVFREGIRSGKPATIFVRTTYLIDEDGVIVGAYGKVKPKENAAQMLEELG